MRARLRQIGLGWVVLAGLVGVASYSFEPAQAAPPRAPVVAQPRGAAQATGESSTYKPEAPYRAALLMDRDSGTVFFAKNDHLRWPPASMVKIMTLLIAMERVRDGSIRLDDAVIASAWASRIGGSQVYLREGEQFPLSELLKAIVIASANDAAVAVAERIAGSAGAFVDLMNQRAKDLGLAETEYHSVHGLPPSRGQSPDLMSAMDLAVLGRKLGEFREISEWAATSEAPFRDGTLVMRNTNHLVRTLPGADGLKTGYYAAAGFEVTATASRDGLRLLAVVLGSPTKRGCFDEAAKLLNMGFANYRAIQPTRAGQAIGAEIAIAAGKKKSLTGVAAADLRFVLPRAEAQQLKVEVKVAAEIKAPIRKGQVLGQLVAQKGDREVGRVDVISPEEIEKTSWWAGCF